jgi:hypothetical protein
VPNQNAPDDMLLERNAEGAKDCSAILRQPNYGLRRFISTTASISSLDGPLGPGRRRGPGLESKRYFRFTRTC